MIFLAYRYIIRIINRFNFRGGFFVMILAAILGVSLIILGISNKKNEDKWKMYVVLGVLFIVFAIWLGWPK